MSSTERFTPQFLDDIRARLPVSVVVGKRLTLRKEGREFKALSPFNTEKTPSFFVNDQKMFWHDFSSGKNGDVFGFLMQYEGMDFPTAVEQCAAEAGLSMPDGKKVTPRPPKKVEDVRAEHTRDDVPFDDHPNAPQREKPKRKPTATYDYEDQQGHLIYQVVRFNFVFADGTTDLNDQGKPKKTFGQRRPFRDEDNTWIWGLDSGEFMRRGSGNDWAKFDAENFKRWGYKDRKRFTDAVTHGLYRLPDLCAALADERTIFLCEGEKKADTLAAWDLAATTNSGGAKHFTDALAARFAGADVVILVDNDDVGRLRGHTVAAMLRKAGAKRIRIVDLSQHWSDCPPKGDVTDWAEAGGTAERLYEIAARTADWRPEPPKSTFGAIRFVDLDLPAREHQWLVKHLIPRGGICMALGKWQSGKSFFTLDLGLTVAEAAINPEVLYLGRRVRGGLVLYQAGEAGTGLKLRARAVRMKRGIRSDTNLPFVIMPEPLNMYASDDPVNAFIAEAKAWTSYYEMPLEMVVIDTFSAATPGANENSSEHVSAILERGNRLARELQATIMWVHHLNAAGDQGKARGHSSLMGNVDAVIEITETENTESEKVGSRVIERTVREAKIIKQKEAARGFRWNFVLKQVEIGRDEDGEAITTCIVAPTGEQAGPQAETGAAGSAPKSSGQFLTDERVRLFRAVLDALDGGGIKPPPELSLPTTVPKVVEWGKVRFAYRKRVAPSDDDAKKHADKIKKNLERFQNFATAANVIAIDSVGDITYCWLTGKPVHGRGLTWPSRSTQVEEEKDDSAPLIDEATGEAITDIKF